MIEYIKEHIWSLLLGLNYILVIFAIAIILFKNINPTKTITYILVLVMFPFIGLLVYYFFGQEYRKSKIFNRKNVLNKSIVKKISEDFTLNSKELEEFDDLLDEKMKLVHLLYNSEHTPLTRYNEVALLKNGKTKFKLLFEDLKKAKHHIHLEYYILKDDNIGTQLIDIICERARNGVSVKVSVDDVGSKISNKAKRKMKESGVECNVFMPVLFRGFTGKLNYRNHRKIAIIDGEIGYVGGINVSDNYVNYKNGESFWRDTHVRIVGEAVKPLQVNFLMTWNFVSNSDLKITEELFPEVKTKHETAVQISASGPDTNWPNIMEAMFVSINRAEDYVYVTTPYFIPNDEIITALQVAAKSNIDVRLIIPKMSDSWTAKHATNSYIEPLLEAGVKVYRYCNGFIHAKTMVVDDILSTVGTTNMDHRSFNINFEINAIIYDKKTSVELKQHFLDDLKESEELDLKRWQERPISNKLKESYARLWSPLL
ncbi:cardiolipin synthase [Hanstruepera ponticola]|uniref:cardiolipin synthase n=1 Tax=Hanstruepera ponticola TaxID=2042995 RepID=UPI000CF0E5EE|nr:cardiolipin synthase [Hanstruepera ponticola]